MDFNKSNLKGEAGYGHIPGLEMFRSGLQLLPKA